MARCKATKSSLQVCDQLSFQFKRWRLLLESEFITQYMHGCIDYAQERMRTSLRDEVEEILFSSYLPSWILSRGIEVYQGLLVSL